MPRCRPNELCIIVESGIPTFDQMLAPLHGTPVTTKDICPDSLSVSPSGVSWHYRPDGLSTPFPGHPDVDAIIHAIPDCCLRPIRPGASEKTFEIPREFFKV